VPKGKRFGAARRQRTESKSPSGPIKRGWHLLWPLSIVQQVVVGLLLLGVGVLAGVVTIKPRGASGRLSRHGGIPSTNLPITLDLSLYSDNHEADQHDSPPS
jgi:hypothetical protein